jgi:transcriptional regulator of aromatic amino acid metabolism
MHKSGVSNDFYLALFRYDWPRNIRELQQKVRQAIARADGRALSAKHLSLETATDVKKMSRTTVMGELYDILKGKLEVKGLYKGKGGGLHQEIAGILGCSASKVSEMAKVSIGEQG